MAFLFRENRGHGADGQKDKRASVPGCQELQMTALPGQSGRGYFIAVPIWQQWASNG